MKNARLDRRVAAEFIGTFGIVLAGAGAIVIDESRQGVITHVGVAATFGLIVMVMIYAVGHISGAHFNPGITLAFAVVRHFPVRDVILYWLAQSAGAVLAAGVLRAMFGNVAHLGATIPSGSDAQSFWLPVRRSAASSGSTEKTGSRNARAIPSAMALFPVPGSPVMTMSMHHSSEIGRRSLPSAVCREAAARTNAAHAHARTCSSHRPSGQSYR